MAELVRSGVRMFTDDGVGVQDARDAHCARVRLGVVASRRRLRDRPGPALRSRRACGRRCNARGEWSSRLGMPGQPAEAEELMIARDLALARLTDGRAFPARHHGPWRRSDPAAKAEGLKVTGEATLTISVLITRPWPRSTPCSRSTRHSAPPPTWLRSRWDCSTARSMRSPPIMRRTPGRTRNVRSSTRSRDARCRDSVCDRQHRT